MTTEQTTPVTREQVRERYAAAAITVLNGTRGGGCCGPAADGCAPPATAGASVEAEEAFGTEEGFGAELYSTAERAELPDAALQASLGCGNPLAVADLHPGETVLDLGSGGGIDVLLSARRVGPTGKAYGLDMTDEMLELARAQRRRGRRDQRRVPQGAHRGHPAARRAASTW